jgi:hypothetical protein
MMPKRRNGESEIVQEIKDTEEKGIHGAKRELSKVLL